MDKIVNSDPLVSVLMPVYNTERHIREAIDSILNQTYINFEFVIINDGSKDESASVINSYKDSRIKLITNSDNKGLIYSLNYGISQCTGKYIVRMDADDISLPERIFEQVKFMEDNPEVGVCGCDYIQFSKTSEKRYNALNDHDEILSFMIFNSSVIHPSLIIRGSILQLLNPVFNAGYNHSEDYELWSKLIFKCKFSAVNKVLFKYRIHEGQVTHQHAGIQLASANNVRKELLDKLGFVYTEKEFMLLCQPAGHLLFTNKQDIAELELFFKKLISQNTVSKIIDTETFNRVISYKWYAACGYTTLGIWALIKYTNSSLKQYDPQSYLKLLAKCMVRYVKKSE